MGASQSKIKNIITKLYMNVIENFKLLQCSEIRIYHLHYMNLEKMKINDLRSNEKDRKYIIVKNFEDGLKYNYYEDNVICLKETDIFPNIQKYVRKY
ncbi:hypothetical protein WX45_02468 [Clostridium ljungdahlii DSM 13528]|uniref:Uncharacterized protein n=2 Tax=Clostridium ljungdahlii TaxID=1538 RepID=A0ABX2TYE7_CLOLD|nr:hypothetical protein WX45_02468 [Clostridium ljungdahlii DSM 13528]